jgi:hypothetical protein
MGDCWCTPVIDTALQVIELPSKSCKISARIRVKVHGSMMSEESFIEIVVSKSPYGTRNQR